jgi:hypothetical protein
MSLTQAKLAQLLEWSLLISVALSLATCVVWWLTGDYRWVLWTSLLEGAILSVCGLGYLVIVFVRDMREGGVRNVLKQLRERARPRWPWHPW